MKRHKALQPLSKDHYVGLTLAMRLMRGKPENLKSNWPTNDNPTLQAQQAIKIFKKDLYDHFKDEEDILFDKARPFLEENDGKELLEKILAQHKEFYDLFAELDQGKEDTIIDRLIYTGELLDSHVRVEERDLFPAIEKFTPEHVLSKLGEELIQRERFDCSTLL